MSRWSLSTIGRISVAVAALLCIASSGMWILLNAVKAPSQTSIGPVTASAAPSAPQARPLPAPRFHFFDKLDREKLKARMDEVTVPLAEQPKPEGMEDVVYEWVARLSYAQADAVDVGTYETEKTGSVTGLCFSSDDKYMVTIGHKLSVWRVQNQELVRQHEMPLENCKQLLMSSDARTATLVSPTHIANVTLVDGKITEQIEVPEKILFACQAATAGHVAVCTEDKRLLLFSKDLSKRIEGPDLVLASPRIAIHPSGRWVLGNHESGMLRWHANPSKVETLSGSNYDPEAAMPLSGPWYDRWIDTYTVHEFHDAVRTQVMEEEPNIPFVITPPVTDAFVCSVGGNSDWLLVIAQNREPEQRDGIFAFDAFIGRQAASRPLTLCKKSPKAIYAAGSGKLLAVQTATAIRVAARRPWIVHTGTVWTDHVIDLFNAGRFDQIELVAEYLRGHHRFPSGKSGEELFSLMLSTLAERWNAVVDIPECEAQAKAAEQWLAEGSNLAILSSAFRHHFIAAEARGGDFASEVPEENWPIIYKENALASEEFAKLDRSSPLPAHAYVLLVTLARDTDAPLDVEAALAEYTMQYPLEIEAHEVACYWSLPRWGGEDRQLGAYVNALCAAYPPEYIEPMYTRYAVEIGGMLSELDGEDFGLDYARATAGLNDWLASQQMTIEQTEAARFMSQMKTHDSAMVEKLSDYHFANFNLPQRLGYYANIMPQLLSARLRVFPQE